MNYREFCPAFFALAQRALAACEMRLLASADSRLRLRLPFLDVTLRVDFAVPPSKAAMAQSRDSLCCLSSLMILLVSMMEIIEE
jgi:hypothetical protein